MMSMEYTGHKG